MMISEHHHGPAYIVHGVDYFKDYFRDKDGGPAGYTTKESTYVCWPASLGRERGRPLALSRRQVFELISPSLPVKC